MEKALVALSCTEEAAPVVQRRVRQFWSKTSQDDCDMGIGREPCPGHRLFFSSRHAGLQLPLHQLL